MTGKADFYIASKPLLSKTKKYYSEIISTQDKDQSNLLHISTFQEIFKTYIGLELRDIAYDSKKFDFYVADEGGSEWDKIELVSPQKIGAEYFGYKEEKDLLKKNKTLKFYRLTKFGKRSAYKRKIYKSLINNIEKLPVNHLEPFPNLEPSYIEFAKFDQVNWLYQRIDDLEVQVKPLIFLDSSLLFQLLLNFETNGKKFPSEFTEQISNQYEFVCLPGVLFNLEEAGYTEFVYELLKEIINLPKLLEIEKFIVNYQDKLDEYGFNNLNIGILSDSVYWNFYVQFHACVAKFLNADTIIIPSDLKKHYLNKNCYNGKFSFFVEPEVKPTSLKCITAKKFWKKIKIEKQKAESDNLKDFVVSSNYKEWEVPNCLKEILEELDQKLITDVNSFWLDIFRKNENQVENEKYFKEFVELIIKFEENTNILKFIPKFSSLIDKNMHYRANFRDIKDYTSKIKKHFKYLIEVNKNRGFINSNELYLAVLQFKSNISNFLRDRFYLKAKFKSPALPTTINFDLFYKDENTHQELSSIIASKHGSYYLQKIIVNSKGRNKNSIRFVPNLQHNDEFIIQLFKKFLFTNYCFHKNELETVYRDFIRFIKVKKEYRIIARDFSFNRFESLILNTQERSLILLEPHGIYYSKLLENFLLLIESYHRVHDTSLSLELSAKILNIKEKELEILIYFIIQKGHMFREKLAQHPGFSLFLQDIKELNDKSTKRPQAMNYSPFWFPKKKKKKKNKIELSQPEIWVEYESEVLDNTPIYYIDKENRVSYSDRLFNVEIKGETFAADVDTGAFKSLMSNDIAERLFPKQKRYITYVSGYTQHTKRVDMIKDIPFHYNGQTFTDDFLIEKNLEKIFRAEVVIGKDGYNKMLVRYYGKTLDNLFDNN
ncbi:MAG: retropepsin-like aspartic protease, partial [Promethearchaeota archaeon]